MGRKVCVALVDSEVAGQQNVPNVARLVREAKVMMARDRARKARLAKAKKGKGGKIASTADIRKVLQSLSVTRSHGKRSLRAGTKKGFRWAKAQVPSEKTEGGGRTTLQLVDLENARLDTSLVTGNGTIVRRVTFTLESGALMKIEEPRS